MRLRRGRQRVHRGAGRPVVHGARLRRAAPGRGGHRRDEQAPLLLLLLPPRPRQGHRPRREAGATGAGADVQGLLHLVGLGSQRHRDQADLVLQQRSRPTRQEEDHQPQQGLPRSHRRHRQPDRARRQPSGLRPADRPHPSHRLPPPLPLRRARRVRAGLRDPARRQPRAADPRGGAGHRCGVHRRAGDGRGRRDRAAGDLLREGAGGAPRIRRAVRGRRGDLRLRAHRQLLGLRDLRPRARHDDHGQGADLGLPADGGGADLGADLPRAGRGERPHRRVRPRLHLHRPSGVRRRRPRGPEDLRGARYRRSRATRRAGAAAGLARPRRPAAGRRGCAASA